MVLNVQFTDALQQLGSLRGLSLEQSLNAPLQRVSYILATVISYLLQATMANSIRLLALALAFEEEGVVFMAA